MCYMLLAIGVGEYLDCSKRTVSVENTTVPCSWIPGVCVREIHRERERRREVQLKRDSLLQVLQGHYLVAFGLLSVAAVSDVVGGLATPPPHLYPHFRTIEHQTICETVCVVQTTFCNQNLCVKLLCIYRWMDR